MVRKIRQVRRKKGSKVKQKRGSHLAASFLFKKSGGKESGLNSFGPRPHFLGPPDYFYQILIRSSGFLYSLSPGFTSKALYQASIFTGAPIVRYWLGE